MVTGLPQSHANVRQPHNRGFFLLRVVNMLDYGMDLATTVQCFFCKDNLLKRRMKRVLAATLYSERRLELLPISSERSVSRISTC